MECIRCAYGVGEYFDFMNGHFDEERPEED